MFYIEYRYSVMGACSALCKVLSSEDCFEPWQVERRYIVALVSAVRFRSIEQVVLVLHLAELGGTMLDMRQKKLYICSYFFSGYEVPSCNARSVGCFFWSL